jgi:hypothetical protein
MRGGGVCQRALSVGISTAFMLLAVEGLGAANIVTNGGINNLNSTTYVLIGGSTGGNPCDTVCTNVGGAGFSGSAPFTIFDNFTIPQSGAMVTGFDFTDFLVGTSTAPTSGSTQAVNWSLWSGDPLTGHPNLVASGTSAAAVLTQPTGYNCGSNFCLERFTVTLGSAVTLSAGQMYYLGTSVVPQGNYLTYRATTGSVPGSQAWEQSNGSIGNGTNSWSAGTINNDLPSAGGSNGSLPGAGVTAQDSAFDIIGTVLTPEPGTMTLMSIAIAGLCLVRRRRKS